MTEYHTLDGLSKKPFFLPVPDDHGISVLSFLARVIILALDGCLLAVSYRVDRTVIL
jgi:hypothetical protein